MTTSLTNYFFALFFTLFISCAYSPCDKIPSNFHTYTEAISTIKSSNFKINESVNTDKSSWIRGLTFYSCDGQKGYLLVKTDKEEYVHKDVPIEVWNKLKNATSFGSYYNQNLKHRFTLTLF